MISNREAVNEKWLPALHPPKGARLPTLPIFYKERALNPQTPDRIYFYEERIDNVFQKPIRAPQRPRRDRHLSPPGVQSPLQTWLSLRCGFWRNGKRYRENFAARAQVPRS